MPCDFEPPSHARQWRVQIFDARVCVEQVLQMVPRSMQDGCQLHALLSVDAGQRHAHSLCPSKLNFQSLTPSHEFSPLFTNSFDVARMRFPRRNRFISVSAVSMFFIGITNILICIARRGRLHLRPRRGNMPRLHYKISGASRRLKEKYSASPEGRRPARPSETLRYC